MALKHRMGGSNLLRYHRYSLWLCTCMGKDIQSWVGAKERVLWIPC